ncbi:MULTISPECIES: anti-sigma factor domain-containing protein [Streptomyces]|uniref:Regulator of SigK n=1 Tax=Streptomyces koelreuteriae TaxID=2838015 RepID=A0ABX8FWI8_9ACTN|nr:MULTISPECIES: anti-sigma factor [Streptomyces]QWB25568.1 anti-sigma factor [Streptomyces koelreuteriae]UUA08615.1 anti-sigma factor [Streptomyces koelreuteriae]UUA16220.1 anti-sigma factor [Streptomyces sp. CRCS-T-1]
MNLTDDPHLAVGAYVLHALPAGERAAFEEHLADCASCRAEVDQASGAAVAMGATETSTPPADLRRRVLERIAAVPQDRTVAAQARRRRRGQRALRLALAASLAAAAALGGIAWWQSSEADSAREEAAQDRAGYRQLADVLAAPDATISTGELARGGTASVIASRAQGQSAFIASGLPPLTDDQVYQLWYARPGQFRPAGLVSGSGGRQAYVLDGRLGGATAVCVTVEPSGGSRQPTTDPVGVISVPA